MENLKIGTLYTYEEGAELTGIPQDELRRRIKALYNSGRAVVTCSSLNFGNNEEHRFALVGSRS